MIITTLNGRSHTPWILPLHILHHYTSVLRLWILDLWWPALPGQWLSYTECWQSLLVMYLTFMFGMLFLFVTTSLGCFCPRIFAFRITDWTCYHGHHLHVILRIISRGVSGLATDSPSGVWGRGWTACLLHDSPLLGAHLKMRVSM